VHLAVARVEELPHGVEARRLEGADRRGVAKVGVGDAGDRRRERDDDVKGEGAKRLRSDPLPRQPLVGDEEIDCRDPFA